ncbi:MAG: hypothetical protein R3A12_20435, partial [Ignavibacteria bacterium]
KIVTNNKETIMNFFITILHSKFVLFKAKIPNIHAVRNANYDCVRRMSKLRISNLLRISGALRRKN